MIKNPFKLEKLKIYVYKDRQRNKLSKAPFKVMFNPESYSLNYHNVFASYQGINTSGRQAQYSLSKPSELSLQLIFDNSGVTDELTGGLIGAVSLVSKLKSSNQVYKQVEKFLKLTTYMDGQIHEPKFLKVEWGELIFDCRLQSVDIKYTLFDRSGNPIRAELNVSFVNDISNSKRVRKENKSSPDLTHVRTAKAGDKLPQMVNEIYENPAYYIQVAHANKLNNFRKLKVGENINFPPIKE